MPKLHIDLSAFSPKFNKGFTSSKPDNFGFTDFSYCFKPKISKYGMSESYKKWHLVFFFCLLTLVIFILIYRAFFLQVLSKDKYLALSEANKTRIAQIQPERGAIFDVNNRLLVRNRPGFSLDMNILQCKNTLDPEKKCVTLINKIGEMLKVNTTDATEQLNSGKTIITLAKGLTKEDLIPIESRLFDYPGVVISVQPLRDYIYADVFSHVIGYVGLDQDSLQPRYVGRGGIEQAYEQYLEGVAGRRIIQVDSSGSSYNVIAEQNSFPGKNIYTYLNLDLQKKAYDLIKEKVDKGLATGGAVVVEDPKSGGVMALVSYPAYDPNKLSYGLTQNELSDLTNNLSYPFFNRAISATYAPGSTFKLVTASAVLQEGVVTKDTSIFDPGYIQVGSYIFRNWKLTGHGDVNLLRALQVSNDTYFYTVGGGYGNLKGLGIEKLANWAKKFGYGSSTGIDIPGEVSGNVPDGSARAWYLGDTYITSIGQGDMLATPLQVNYVTNYFANGGYFLVPHIVKKIDTVGDITPVIKTKNIISSQNYTLVRTGMKMVASPGGTAYPLFDFPQRYHGVQLAAKTGTSEYTDEKGKDRTHAWLTAFGPFEDPTISMTVFLEGGGAGSDDATPIAKELMDIWFKDK
jgi:penicillin-binding protein 2